MSNGTYLADVLPMSGTTQATRESPTPYRKLRVLVVGRGSLVELLIEGGTDLNI